MNQAGSKYHRTLPDPTRRRFLLNTGITAGAAVGFTALGLMSRGDHPIKHPEEPVYQLRDYRVESSGVRPDLVLVHGDNAELLVREALVRLGGIRRFIAKGDRVVLKPNVGWDRQPEQAANTNPKIVGAVTRSCMEAGAAEVLVTDVSLNDPRRCFVRSGIQDAALAAGGLVRLPGVNDFLPTDMHGELLKVWPVARYFHRADKLINLPLVKHHSLCGCTLSMKNWYGVLGGRRNQLHQRIHTSIVDLASAVRPTLTLMDATRVLKHNGPTGGSLDDVSIENTLIAGTDEVAIDSYSLRFLDVKPEAVPFLELAQRRGLGTMDWRNLRMVESQV